MKVIRWILALIFSLSLSIVVFIGIPLGVLTHIIAKPERVKLFVEDSGIYDNIESILSEVIPLAFMGTEGTVVSGEGDDYMAVLIAEIVTPEFLKTNIEESVDTFYSWLEGESEYPQIEINLAEDKDKITQILVLSLSGRIKALPACTGDPVSLESVNPFTMECIPSGFNVDNFEEDLEEQMLAELGSSEDADTVFEQFIFKTKPEDFNTELTQNARSAYRIATFVPTIIIVLVLLLLLLIILLIPNIKSKFTFPGVLLILVSLPASLSKIIILPNIGRMMDTNVLSPALFNILEVVFADILGKVSVVGCIVLLIGMVLIVTGVVMKSKTKNKPVREKEKKKETEVKEVKST